MKNKILIFRFGHIGDTVAALPSLWVLRRQFPSSQIVILNEVPPGRTYRPPETVLPPNLVNNFEQYSPGTSLKNLIGVWKQLAKLRRQGFSTLVYLVPSDRPRWSRLRDIMFFRMAGFKSILAQKGFAKNLRPKAKEGTLIRKPKEADALLERLRIDGLQVPLNGQGCMDLQITHAERGKVKKWWHKKGETCAPWVAVCTGGKTNSQLWPWERYGEVMHLLIKEQGLFPIVVGGREDREIGEKLVRQWGTGLCAAGELSVRESAALMEGARFYLGNDTGVMHLAAAVGIPCVAIFSARNWPGTWEPYGSGHKVLRFDVPCSGCSLSTCNQQLQCLSNITVQEVYRACLEVLGSGNALKTKSC